MVEQSVKDQDLFTTTSPHTELKARHCSIEITCGQHDQFLSRRWLSRPELTL